MGIGTGRLNLAFGSSSMAVVQRTILGLQRLPSIHTTGPLGCMMLIALWAPQRMWIQNLPSHTTQRTKGKSELWNFSKMCQAPGGWQVPVAWLDVDMTGLKIQNGLLFPWRHSICCSLGMCWIYTETWRSSPLYNTIRIQVGVLCSWIHTTWNTLHPNISKSIF